MTVACALMLACDSVVRVASGRMSLNSQIARVKLRPYPPAVDKRKRPVLTWTLYQIFGLDLELAGLVASTRLRSGPDYPTETA